MTRRRPTRRAFTVAICTGCDSDHVVPALTYFRALITRCPHGMLVRTSCLLGTLTCASRPAGAGVVIVLQPCAIDRTPTGPPRWFGPIDNVDDLELLCDFVEFGAWDSDVLPDHLYAHRNWAMQSSRRN